VKTWHRSTLALAGAALLAGCGSTPPSRYYTLDVPTSAASPAAAPVAALRVGPVVVPDTIDRAPLVLRRGPNRVEILESDLWAQPLKQEIARVLAAHLGARWPQALVRQDGPVPAGDARLLLEVLQFEAGEREVQLALGWTLLRGGAPGSAPRGTVRASEPMPAAAAGPGQDATVAALSRALASAARTLGEQLEALR
jgi:uncharacterized protein